MGVRDEGRGRGWELGMKGQRVGVGDEGRGRGWEVGMKERGGGGSQG